MSPRKKVPQVINALSPEGWPHRAVLGRNMVAGYDRDGYLGLAEVGTDIYGRQALRNFVQLSADEVGELMAFLAEVRP